MKKMNLLVTLILVLALVFTGCSNSDGAAEKSEDQLRVILLIPGSLGDKSFFDSANKGMEMVKSELGAEIKVIEMGTDFTKWEPNLLDALEGEWDIIVSGNSMTEMMNTFAVDYPDQNFINFDSFETQVSANVYGVQYKANELSFLAGSVAALVSQSDMEYADDNQMIGFLGGMDIPGINDFLVGYIEGALYVNEDTKVMISYAGDFGDPAKGKELSLLQYNSGVDISFNVAGGTGLGLLDAAKDQSKYAIGVDSDQALLFEDTDPEKSTHILTSAIKKIDQAVFNAVKEHVEGSLEYGIVKQLGVAEGGVGLAKNKYYDQLSDDIKDTITDIEAKLNAGEIEVGTAYGLETDEINAIREQVRP